MSAGASGAAIATAPQPTPPACVPAGAMAASAASPCADQADGLHCIDGTQLTCASGNVERAAPCGITGCETATACSSPGSASAASEQGAMATGTTPDECDVFAPSVCADCLEARCCSDARACVGDGECNALWACLNDCGGRDLACETRCAQAHPDAMQRAAALIACSTQQCAQECGAQDPCVIFPAPRGLACGPNLGLSDKSDRLYLCENGVTIGTVTCRDGCLAAPLGSPDYCLDADPCASSPLNGSRCGVGLSPGADPGSLYYCCEQRTTGSYRCPNGCVRAASGIDRCR